MPIVVSVMGKGLTSQMYEALRKEVMWESRPAAGCYLHISAFDEAGNLRVTDVWETEETFKAFLDTRLVPVMKKLGIPEPGFSIYPAYTVNVFAPAIQQFAITERVA